MRLLSKLVLVCASVLFVTGAKTNAQSVLTPKFWTWKFSPPCGVAPDPSGLITNMIRVDCVGTAPSGRLCDATPPSDDAAATAAGIAAADRVLAHRAPNWPPAFNCNQTGHGADLNDTNLVISFFNWGRDAPDTDSLFGDTPNMFGSRLRFFTENDRIGTDAAFLFPAVPEITRDECRITSPGAFSNRTYRHPFLVNAESLNAPLKLWTRAFLTAYKAGVGNIAPPHAFYLDCEPFIAYLASIEQGQQAHDSANGCWMLFKIRENPAYWNRVLPGDAQGRTLSERYENDHVAFGLPWPDSRLIDPSNAYFEPRLSSAHPTNRRIMHWWVNVICREAIEQVYENCMWSEIRAAFPTNTPRYGNYQSYRTDGALSPTAMTYDATCFDGGGTDCGQADAAFIANPSGAPFNPFPAGSTHPWTNMLPRTRIDTNMNGALRWRFAADGTSRWGQSPSNTDATVDSPEVYPILSLNSHTAHRQYDYYKGPAYRNGPVRRETSEETDLRLMRHTIKSITNSPASAGRLFVPWVYSAGAPYDYYPPSISKVMSKPQFTRVMGELRAARTPEVILFDGYNPDNIQQSPGAINTWKWSRDIAEGVWAARAISYSIPPGNTYLNGTGDGDASRLEFALRDAAGNLKTVDVQSDASYHTVTLFTTFDGLTDYREYYDFLIRFEGSASASGVKYRLMVKHDDTNWYPVPNTEAKAFEGVYTPDLSARATFRLNEPYNGFVRNNGRMELMFYAWRSSAFALSTDLVQIVPEPRVGPTIVRTSCEPPIAANNGPDNPVQVPDVAFSDGYGIRLQWTEAINTPQVDLPSGQQNATPYAVRLYVVTGNSDKPIEDITCRTRQELEGSNRLKIQYAPGGVPSLMPAGNYLFSTADLYVTWTSCGWYSYTRVVASNTTPIEGERPVANERIFFHVFQDCNDDGYSNDPINCRGGTCGHGICVADFTGDGSPGSLPDGGVGIEDLLFYLSIYDLGIVCADVDDGNGTGNGDGGVGIEDLLYYLDRYDAGC